MTAQFQDALGNQFDVMYDAATGNVLRLRFDDNHGSFSTIVTKENGTTLWTATRLEKNFSTPAQSGTSNHQELAQASSPESSARPKNRTLELVRPQEPIPVFTRVLADARFDDRLKQLTIASSRLTKRWVFRANGKADYFSAEGHRSFA
jgi:hypothetical protein